MDQNTTQMKFQYFSVFILIMLLFSCEDILEPVDENRRSLEDIYEDARFAEGILLNAYTRLPTSGYSFNDVATDDAVTNDLFNGFLKIATGSWTAINNPTSSWTNAYTAIAYLNLILQETNDVTWSYLSEDRQRLFNARHKGEAYALRALYYYYLLQAHGGEADNGELLGVPIINDVLDVNTDFDLPRNTFEEVMQQIYLDLDKAEAYLPLDYIDISNENNIPNQYEGVSIENYNQVFGLDAKGRVSGRIAKGIRAKAAMLAASPAFSSGTTTTWEDAADLNANLLFRIGGPGGLDPQGHLWYRAANADAISRTIDQPEMLWRGNPTVSNGIERNNFPPSLFGNGRINPTQNLVDAFPMVNGYPITNGSSGYDPANPYAGRDPRLNQYIVTNSGTLSGTTIFTETGSGNDAVDVLPISTRTGYYMKKLLREDVNLNPLVNSVQRHYPVHIRYTEIFLNYAEAANEAFGPTGTSTWGFSAYDVMAAIRQRAGIAQPDLYLQSIQNDQAAMRELIRNERRLELCFEGFRFWDLRRWGLDLNEPALGVTINNGVFSVQEIEVRDYQDYMQYGPIPFDEIARAGLVQNNGW